MTKALNKAGYVHLSPVFHDNVRHLYRTTTLTADESRAESSKEAYETYTHILNCDCAFWKDLTRGVTSVVPS